MSRSSRLAVPVLLAAVLTGCASVGARGPGNEPALPAVTVDEFIAMQPPGRTQPIGQAQRDLRMAERRAERAALLIPIAEANLRMAEADAERRAAGVERAESQLALVRRQHQAVFAGVPADARTVPQEVQAALARFEEAENAVDVARWEKDAADAVVRVREEELAYARAFEEAARRDVDMQRSEVDLEKIGFVSRSTAQILPGVTDPRLSTAQARVREAQAEYARAHADAMTRLSSAQLRRAAMASFQGGPPSMASLSGAGGQSGAAGLAPQAMPLEPEPLPWPDAWEEPAAAPEAPAQPRPAAPAPRPPAPAEEQPQFVPGQPSS